MKKLVLIALLFTVSISCGEDDNEDGFDCRLVDCVGFPSLHFEILSEGENVFEQNLLTTDEISLSGDFPDPSELTIIQVLVDPNTEEKQLLIVSSIAWTSGTYDFNLNISDSYTTNVLIEVEKSPEGGCCGGTPFFKSLRIDNEAIQNPNGIITLDITL